MDKTQQFLSNLPRVLKEDGGIAHGPSDAVIANAISFVKGLPAYYQKIIDPVECITATGHGTITFDWYYRKNLVSVEIGTTKIGWFTELPDGSNPSCNGILLQDSPPTEVIRCLDAIYGRRELKK